MRLNSHPSCALLPPFPLRGRERGLGDGEGRFRKGKEGLGVELGAGGSTAGDAARTLGADSRLGTPALATAGLVGGSITTSSVSAGLLELAASNAAVAAAACGAEAGELAWGEWGGAVMGRVAQVVGEAGRVVAAALPPESAVLVTACVVGLITGASVSLFNEAVHAIRDTEWQGVPPEEGSTWLHSQSVAATWHLHIFVPLAGGVAVGILNTARSEIKDLPLVRQPPRGSSSSNSTGSAAHGYGSGSESSSGDGSSMSLASRAAQSATHNLVAVLRPMLKAVAAAVTLGTGNSLGPEVPSVEIGASVGKGASVYKGAGRVLQGGRERTIALVGAGSTAGISAGESHVYAAELIGLESVLRSSVSSSPASLTTAMVLLASVLAAVLSQQILGSDPAVHIPLYEFRSPASQCSSHCQHGGRLSPPPTHIQGVCHMAICLTSGLLANLLRRLFLVQLVALKVLATAIWVNSLDQLWEDACCVRVEFLPELGAKFFCRDRADMKVGDSDDVSDVELPCKEEAIVLASAKRLFDGFEDRAVECDRFGEVARGP
ncbi:unnamed protein product [Closterium sp. NIES-64]|nr:unnamed protein product [Closterium sp. NIES-64]